MLLACGSMWGLQVRPKDAFSTGRFSTFAIDYTVEGGYQSLVVCYRRLRLLEVKHFSVFSFRRTPGVRRIPYKLSAWRSISSRERKERRFPLSNQAKFECRFIILRRKHY